MLILQNISQMQHITPFALGEVTNDIASGFPGFLYERIVPLTADEYIVALQ